jgi:hypothetical protein
MNRFQAFARDLAREFPGFRVVTKEDSLLMRTLYWLLAMPLWNRVFLTHYTTVLVYRVYMPRALIGTDAGYRTLRHERVHMRDARRTGILPFAISYLFLLPTVLTLRAYWELRAYVETLRVELEETGAIPDESLERIATRFTGSDYFFMCPFPRFIRGQLAAARARLLEEATRDAARFANRR